MKSFSHCGVHNYGLNSGSCGENLRIAGINLVSIFHPSNIFIFWYEISITALCCLNPLFIYFFMSWLLWTANLQCHVVSRTVVNTYLIKEAVKQMQKHMQYCAQQLGRTHSSHQMVGMQMLIAITVTATLAIRVIRTSRSETDVEWNSNGCGLMP